MGSGIEEGRRWNGQQHKVGKLGKSFEIPTLINFLFRAFHDSFPKVLVIEKEREKEIERSTSYISQELKLIINV
ncbi:hypothetical protein KFK09_011786 [Dendrobium nobile]|uniref:Uncharacterized protein n=1 Tax=Dendrobium nobile TaxID=94219 RepID=A0A8T3BGV0_DENNO|nr:hypothetical protein KFK09_011786 [Dendrobium nobile]